MQHYKIQKSLKSSQSDATSESVVEHVKNVTPSHELPEEELFEPNIEVTYIIPQEELANTVIEERFVVGELIARGHIGTVWNGNRMIFVERRKKRKKLQFSISQQVSTKSQAPISLSNSLNPVQKQKFWNMNTKITYD